MRIFRPLSLVATCLLISTAVSAAEKTIAGKVKAVDAAKNSITVDNVELDVSRKTKIFIDGEKATLAEIKAGQQAKVTYDGSLEAAISIVIGREAKADEAAATKVMKALQGEWKCTYCEQMGGEPDTKQELKANDRRVTIEGNSYSMQRTHSGKRSGYGGKFEINPANGTFDWIGEGPGGGLTKWIGIYELDGDTLKVCYRYNEDGKAQRPTK